MSAPERHRPDGTPQHGGSRRAVGRAVVLTVAVLALLLGSAVALVAAPDRDRAAARTEHASFKARHPALPARRRGHTKVTAARPAAAAEATVILAPPSQAIPVPRSFFGVSTEYYALPLYERHQELFERVLSLLRVPGGGPMVLRIGGDSADLSSWAPRLSLLPHWAFGVTPRWLEGTGALVRSLGLRVILDLNLVTGSPLRAARWARIAEARLPRGSIVGFEIGNEPDLYTHWYWEKLTERAPIHPRALPIKLSAPMYTRDFLAYARLLEQIAPNVPLVGPAIANPTIDAGWIANLIEHAGAALGMVSAHRYPLSSCIRHSSVAYPSIARVLGEGASTGVAKSVTPAIRLAHTAGLPFRLTELNSVTCGGLAGVSDTFATALWAPDTLFELLRAGADGVNVHIRANPINAPFALNDGGLLARPLLYGLTLFARTLGPGSRLIPARVYTSPSAHLKVWAVRVNGSTVHLLVLDKGSRSVNVNLNVAGTGPATVQRLQAPSAAARTGVTLAGQHLSTDGRWLGRRTVQRIARGRYGYRLAMHGYSAALVSVRLRPATIVTSNTRLGIGHSEHVLRRGRRTR